MKQYKRPTSSVTCIVCGKQFDKETRELKRSPNHCCSLKCVHNVKAKNANPFTYNKNVAKKNAKSKGLEFDLTEDFLLALYNKQNKKCAITGVLLTFVDKSNKQPTQVSIDRLDNNKGYTEDNVQLVALSVNYMRNSFTMEQLTDFLALLK